MQYVVELQKICAELVSALCPNLDKRNLYSYSIAAAAAAATATVATGIFAKSICVTLVINNLSKNMLRNVNFLKLHYSIK